MKVEAIYAEAHDAQSQWQELSIQERLTYFKQLKRLLANQSSELADLIQQTNGKHSFEALTAEILTVLTTISYWEKNAVKQLKRQKTKTPYLLWGRRSWVEFRPRGTVLVIAPWNYPLQLTLIPALSALLAGNAVIVKPSEVTSQLDQCLGDLFAQANFPSGLIQVVSGDGEVGESLVAGGPDMILFTGSVDTGKRIQAEAAKRLIPTILELGGKDAFIVLKDAPLERAIEGALWGSFTNSGQVCLSTERIYVHESIYETFLQGFLAGAEQLTLKPLTWSKQAQVVNKQVQDAISQGAVLASGDLPTEVEEGRCLPLVLVNVKEPMTVATEESFGPVVCISPFSCEEEVVRLANATEYGLGASVWSRDLNRARNLASRLTVGNVSINDTMITVANPDLPFGGLKSSGLGFYHGGSGLQVFCTQTAIMESRGTLKKEINWYPYTKEKQALILALIENVYGNKGRWWELVTTVFNPRLWRNEQ